MKRLLYAGLLPAALVLTISLATFAAACTSETKPADKIGVAVTLLPQADFIEHVGGEKVDITIMVPPGASPHTYEPTPSQMAALTKAEMYAQVGSRVEFELVWMDKLIAINQKMLIIDCSEGIELREMVDNDEHGHSAMDPHIWLSPLNAKIMVRNISDGLVQVDPENKTYYLQNRDAYIEKLEALDKDIRNGLASVKNRAFLVFHAAWGYFSRDYGLEQIPIEVGGEEPSAQDIASLIKEAKEHNIRVVFASPQFNPESAEVIAREINGRVVLIDPLAKDYIANMRLVLREMTQAMV
jgi:zinc transport system substrate-binding protein